MRSVISNNVIFRRHHLRQLLNKSKTCSTAATSANAAPIRHLPPLIIRVGIISTAVGLATPVFATAGVVRIWYSYLPRTAVGQGLKYLIGFFGGGGAISILYNHVIPFLRDHSNFVLPFALANGVASGFWFLVGELTFGLPFMSGVISVDVLKRALPAVIAAIFITPSGASLFASGLPVGGVVIGALTAITAPFIWPIAFEICWDENLKNLILDGDPLWLLDLYQYFGIPVALPVGIISGLSMHFALKSSIVGTPGIPWKTQSLPVLALLCGFSSAYFYFFQTPSSEFLWESRMDHSTGKMISYNPITKISDIDINYAITAELQRDFATGIHALRKPLKFLQNIAIADEKKKKTILGGTISTANIENRKAVYSIIDLLVRLKYLQLSDDCSQKDIDEISLTSSNKIGITDLNGFLNCVELAVIANRRKKMAQNTDDKEDVKSSNLIDELTKVGISYQNNNSGNDSHGVNVLFENLILLETEFTEKLNYKIADTSVKEVEMLTAYNSRKYLYRILFIGGLSGVLIGAIGLLREK